MSVKPFMSIAEKTILFPSFEKSAPSIEITSANSKVSIISFASRE